MARRWTGSGLGVGDNLTVDGSAETTGKFLVCGGNAWCL